MSVITIHGMQFETVYDNSENISAPVVCTAEKPTVNNINLSGLNTIVEQNPNNLWGEESLSDFRDLLENEPSDKIFVTVGEIILSPRNNPEAFYLFKQQAGKNGKTYLFIEKLMRTKGKSKRVKKSQPTKKTHSKKTSEKPPEIIKPVKEEKAKSSPKPKAKKETKNEDSTQINPECFFMMRMAEALMDYVKLTYPNDLKRYKKIVK